MTQNKKFVSNSKNENKNEKILNLELIDVLDKIAFIYNQQGDSLRAKAYSKAQEILILVKENIYLTNFENIKNLKGIGTSIFNKLKEYVINGTLDIIENHKNNPINIFCDIYGIGPKKAEELVASGIYNIETLRQNQEHLLNNIQKVGLKYYEDLLERIPRNEIEIYDKIFQNIYNKIQTKQNEKYEIVGSYRRGAETSGDIDVILTGSNNDFYLKFIEQLLKMGIIIEILSSGPIKTLVIAKLTNGTGNGNKNYKARRVDFLFSPNDEYPFALLYFTGNKIFNTLMRQHALNNNYTFNEHGIYKLVDKKKNEKVNNLFVSEKCIFDFLNLEYKEPKDRNSIKNIIIKSSANISADIDANISADISADIDANISADIDANISANIGSYLNQFKSKGIQYLDTLNENELNSIIIYCNNKYYNEQPVISDYFYDIIKDFIEKKYPKNNTITKIGANVSGSNKVKLPYFMGSMNKIKNNSGNNEIEIWKNKYNGPYVISTKLDGVSALLIISYQNQNQNQNQNMNLVNMNLYTRGNGTYGLDISHLIPYLKIPNITKNDYNFKENNNHIAIRGELIISKTNFDTYFKNTKLGTNARNSVSGLVNSKIINNIKELYNFIDFIAYEVINPKLKPIQQFEFLNHLHFNCANNILINPNKLNDETLTTILSNWRFNYKYYIDGIIISDNNIYKHQDNGNPQHSFAFKMIFNEQIMETKVVDVIWTPSKDGYLKPRVQIEPINIDGIVIEYATGFNGAFIKNNNIGIGAIIEIIRSGDVIPHIKSVLVPSENPKMPNVSYIWNQTGIDILLENGGLDDPIVKEKNILCFFKGLEVEGFGSGNITKLCNTGFDSVSKIIKMNYDDFLTIPGFKDKMASKLHNNLINKLKEVNLVQICAYSNIFGRGFNEKKIETILSEIGFKLFDNNISQSNKINSICNVKGIGIKSAELFVSKIDKFLEFLNECDLNHKLNEYFSSNSGNNNHDNNNHDYNNLENYEKQHEFYKKNIVLTGTRDNIIISFLKNCGANISNSVSKNSYLVIAKDLCDSSTKTISAKKYGINIISVEQFKEKYLL